jgi:hypothetical protein
VGHEGVEAQGKYNLLPIKLIGELDRRFSRPLHLDLTRPQIRSHPYLQGLNLLLRASGLTRIEKLERIEPPTAKLIAPRILESQGKTPKPCQCWDD